MPASADIPWLKLEARYYVAFTNLGPFAAEFYLHADLQRRLLQLRTYDFEDDMEALRTSFLSSDASGVQNMRTVQLDPGLQEIQEVLTEYVPIFEDPEGGEEKGVERQEQEGGAVPWAFGSGWYAPKVKVLVDTLLAHYTEQFQGIVFVEQRHIATCLAKLLARIPELRGLIRCAECVGHGGQGDVGPADGMRDWRQRAIVSSFREGKINLCQCSFLA